MSGSCCSNTNLSDNQAPSSWVEPSPDWVETLRDLTWMWYAHIYGFGASFLVLALCSLASVIGLFRSGRSRAKRHFIVTGVLLFFLGALRATILFWDPYLSSRKNTSKAVVFLCVVSWGIAKACLTSAFSIMLLIFLETTRIALAPPRFQNLSFLLAVAFINIGYLVLSDAVVVFYPVAKVLILICQVTFALWGLLVCLGYFLAWKRMHDNLVSSKNLGNQVFSNAETKRLSRLKFLMQAASLFGGCNFVLTVYIAVSDLGVLSEMGSVDGWSWYGTQTSLRLLELLISVFIILVGNNNNKRSNQQTAPSRQSQEHFTTRRSTKVGVSELTVEDVKQ